MTGPAHDRARLGAYALGVLDPAEARQVHEHLSTCPDCRREVGELMTVRRALDQVPPEAFVDGPPEDGDLVLRRTLRQVRDETPTTPRRVPVMAAVAAAVAVLVALGGGILIGRQTAPDPVAGPPPTATAIPSNARLAEATDPGSGATMNVALEPKKGWVWVNATVTGLDEGLRCELYVVTKDGQDILAGGWLVSAEGSAKGTALEGTALIPPDEVRAVEIRTEAGKTMVSVPL